MGFKFVSQSSEYTKTYIRVLCSLLYWPHPFPINPLFDPSSSIPQAGKASDDLLQLSNPFADMLSGTAAAPAPTAAAPAQPYTNGRMQRSVGLSLTLRMALLGFWTQTHASPHCTHPPTHPRTLTPCLSTSVVSCRTLTVESVRSYMDVAVCWDASRGSQVQSLLV